MVICSVSFVIRLVGYPSLVSVGLAGLDTFFAKTYHAWERGLNEHTNGDSSASTSPKATAFATVSADDVQKVEELLNQPPTRRVKVQDATGGILKSAISAACCIGGLKGPVSFTESQ